MGKTSAKKYHQKRGPFKLFDARKDRMCVVQGARFDTWQGAAKILREQLAFQQSAGEKGVDHGLGGLAKKDRFYLVDDKTSADTLRNAFKAPLFRAHYLLKGGFEVKNHGDIRDGNLTFFHFQQTDLRPIGYERRP